MTKLKLKKSIISLVVGIAMCLCSLPLNLFTSLSASAAKSVYPTNETIDVNGEFKLSGSSVPNKWSINTNYSNDNNNSTSYNGVINTELSGWAGQYEQIVENITDVINANLTFSHPEEQTRQEIIEAIEQDLAKPNSPLVPGFDLDTTTNYKILMLSAGKSYTPTISNDVVQLQPETRSAYVEYKSNSFDLAAYSFYKISVWVKVDDSANAFVSLGGDIEDVKFDIDSTKTNAKNNIEYFFYTFINGSTRTQFISTVNPTAGTIEYNGVTFTYDAQSQEFLPSDAENTTKVKYTGNSEQASYSDWTCFSMYVSTVNAKSTNISLSLGEEDNLSSGNVYFNNVKVEKIQLVDYANAVANSTTIIHDEREILNQNNSSSRDYSTIQDFEEGNNWFVVQNDNGNHGIELSVEPESDETKINETFIDSDSDGVNEILKADNYSSNAITIESPKFTIGQFGYYRVSLWALSTNKNASLVVNLTSFANNKDVTATNKTSPYTTSRNNANSTSITNYWIEYVFMVKANPLYDTDARFTIQISKNTAVYFDNIVIEKITRADYDDTKKTTLDLSKTTLTDTITNGRFNSYESVDYSDYSLPLPPASWSSIKKQDVYTYYSDIANKEFDKAYFETDLTISSDKKVITLNSKEYVQSTDENVYNYTKAGEKSEKIVKIPDAEFAYKASENGYYHKDYKLNIPSNVVAGILSGYNNAVFSPNGYTENVLSINSPDTTTFAYKSAEIKFNTNNVLYSVYVDVMTIGSANAALKLVDDKGNVFAKLTNINTSDSWQTYTFYVASGYEAKSLYLELVLDDSQGTVYFKKAVYKQASATTSLNNNLTESPEAIRNKNLAIVDLSKENFIENSGNLNNTTHLYDTLLYTQNELEGKTSGIYGILDTNNSHSDYATIKPNDKEISAYVLVLKNLSGQSTSIKSIKNITTAKSTSTKITIVAKTIGIEEGKSATISFGALNKSFSINSEEYQTFTLYVDNSNSDKAIVTDYTIELLDSKGTVIIDSITFTKESSIESVKSSYNNKDTDEVKFATFGESKDKNNEKDENEKQAENENRTLEILMAIISSLLLVAAIIFALVITRMKAIKKPKKASSSNKVKSTIKDDEKGFI